MIAVFATVRAKPGRRDELIEALRAGTVDDAAGEPGTIVHAMHANLREEDLLHYYELYESKEAFITHAKVAGPKLNAVAHLVVGPPELVQTSLVVATGLPTSP